MSRKRINGSALRRAREDAGYANQSAFAAKVGVNRARAGATLWELMAEGGWTNPQTVMRYVNLARAVGR